MDTIAQTIAPGQLADAIGATRVGTGYRCPQADHHNNADANPSLSISRKDGRTVSNCHTCGLAGSPVQVAAAIWGVPLPEAATRLASHLGIDSTASLRPDIVAEYDYEDVDGQPLFQVVRLSPKDFRMRRRIRGEWAWNLGDTARVLFRLPELVEAVSLGTKVHVVEGEKDVLAIVAAGGVGTSNPGGAGKWKDEFSEYLRDAEVVVVADKDEMGRKHAAAVAASLEAVRATVRVVEPKAGKDASDHLAAGHSLDDFVLCDPPAKPVGPVPATKPNQAQILLEIASEFDVWHSPDQEAFASLTIDGHRENHRVRSRSIRLWLVKQFYQLEGKPPHSEALHGAIRTLEARAHFDGVERPAHLRVGALDGSIFIDLADARWRAVRVTPDGWHVDPRPAARFARAPGMLPLPDPLPGGSIDLLRPFVNLDGNDDFRVLVAWLVAALRPTGPFPIEILQGEQGSAKSTTQRVQRALIDPSTAPLRSPPREERDLVIAAKNGWVLALDNASSVSNWLSDALCRLSTGGGWATRQLYTDTDEVLFDGQRPLLVNGIGDLATRDDLRDRALILNLPQIPDRKRRPELEFWEEFEEAHPSILGALLDAVSAAMRRESSVVLPGVPRMADFATWATAAEEGLSWPGGSFLASYEGNRRDAVEISMEFNPIATAIRDLIAESGNWEGTAAELLSTLEDRVPERGRGRKRDWPTDPRSVSNAVNRAAATLRRVGIDVDRRRTASKRLICISKGPQDSVTCVTSVTGECSPLPDVLPDRQMLAEGPLLTDDAMTLRRGERHVDSQAGRSK